MSPAEGGRSRKRSFDDFTKHEAKEEAESSAVVHESGKPKAPKVVSEISSKDVKSPHRSSALEVDEPDPFTARSLSINMGALHTRGENNPAAVEQGDVVDNDAAAPASDAMEVDNAASTASAAAEAEGTPRAPPAEPVASKTKSSSKKSSSKPAKSPKVKPPPSNAAGEDAGNEKAARTETAGDAAESSALSAVPAAEEADVGPKDQREEEDEPEAGPVATAGEMTPRHTQRAAAALAKSKLISRGTPGENNNNEAHSPRGKDDATADGGEPLETTTPRVKSAAGSSSKAKSASGSKRSASAVKSRRDASAQDGATPSRVVVAEKFACCDKCEKWRRLPSHVDEATLPEVWLCSMNEWDPDRATCAAPEEDFEATKAAAAAENGAEDGGQADGSDGEDEVGGGSIRNAAAQRNKTKSRGSLGANKSRRARPEDQEAGEAPDSDNDAANGIDTAKKRAAKRGTTAADTNRSPTKAGDTAVVQDQWVMCDKCTKWRRVPPEINAYALPKVWYCHMNTWAPQFARCGIRQEKAEKPQNDANAALTGNAAANRGKVVRRNEKGDAAADGVGQTGGQANPAPSTAGGVAGQPPKKILTKWIQCDRKNCQKWRKVAAHVDMDTMPEKWCVICVCFMMSSKLMTTKLESATGSAT